MAELRHVPATAPVEEVVRILREDGGVIVDDLIDAPTVAAVNAEIDGWVAHADPAMRHLNPAIQIFFGDRTKHVGGIAGKSRTFATRVMIHPLFLGICDAVLGPSCATYQLNLAHLIARGPGADHQLLHRDELVWNLVPRPHPELQLASIVALVDFDASNGATRVAPGSHRWDHDRHPEPHEIADATMRAGSAVVYLGSTIHGGGANSTADRWRRGVHMSYTLGWLRTEENNYLAVPPAIARTLPRRCQEVLGYAVHDALAMNGGYLGMVSLRDPLELLDEGRLGEESP
ncbi:MAG TPA: phytanoyl-CoA dioxygenase family protein [Candidatus Eisenbacteria bacterium]|nr:phytanoyl-CoA dioxygenase family protein [Candidatus Eisenbacteria bacterium]